MITFVIQNETHALNFAPIIEALQDVGIDSEKLQMLHLDEIYGLSTYDLLSVPNQKMVELSIPKPYYHLSGIKRFLWLWQTRRKLETYIKDTNVLVFGSDGGIQRLMANAVRKNKGKVILLLDGLLYPWSDDEKQKYIVKKNINKFFVKFNLNHFVPADIGHSNLDHIYVMHSSVKDILIDQGVKTPIDVITLPRFDSILQDYQDAAKNKQRNHCLYVTGAFKWHGLHKEARQQQQDLTDLIRFAECHSDWEIRIRVHPRESIEDYTNIHFPPNVVLSMGTTPVQQDLGWASIMVTGRSTMAYEAELVGVPVLIYTKNFSHPHKNSFFHNNPYFLISDDLEDMLQFQGEVRTLDGLQSSVPYIVSKIKQYFDDYVV